MTSVLPITTWTNSSIRWKQVKWHYKDAELTEVLRTCSVEQRQILRIHIATKITITPTTPSRECYKAPSDMKGHKSARHVHSNSTILSMYLTLPYKGITQFMNMIKIGTWLYIYIIWPWPLHQLLASNGTKGCRSFAKAGATPHLSRVPGSLQEP